MKYLQSERVQTLLSPFCNKGNAQIGAWHESHVIEDLEPRPVSLSELSSHAYRPLDPSKTGVSGLVYAATAKMNDRGTWSHTKDNWKTADGTFKNLNGEMVNPYVEAQRIIREHGQILIELEMLVR